MTDQHHIASLETRLADTERALQGARAELDALREQNADHAEIIGDLIARMVHDLNNLNTRIRSSSTTITHSLNDVRSMLGIIICQVTIEEQQAFLALMERAWQQKSQAAERISLREERRLRRALNAELDGHHLDNIDEMSDVLVDMGIYADIAPFLPLLRSSRQEELLQAIYGLASLHDVVRWNLNPAFDRIKHITHALRSMIVALLNNDRQETRIPAGIEQVLALFANLAERRKIHIITHYDEIPTLCCYAGLELVWTNLLENAIEALPEEGGEVEIRVTRRAADIAVSMTDSGRGIPEPIQARLFERDATTKPSGADVHGAGLYIAEKIIRKHQGRIDFESRPGRTVFTVSLPLHVSCIICERTCEKYFPLK